MGDPLLGMGDLPSAGMAVEKMLELESCRMWSGFDSSEIPGGFDKSGFGVFLWLFASRLGYDRWKRCLALRPLFLFTHVSLVLLGLEFTIVCPALA